MGYIVYVYKDGIMVSAHRFPTIEKAQDYCRKLPIDLIGQIEKADE